MNYIPEGLILKVEITPTMKSYVKRVLGHIKRIIRGEELPPIRVGAVGVSVLKRTCVFLGYFAEIGVHVPIDHTINWRGIPQLSV